MHSRTMKSYNDVLSVLGVTLQHRRDRKRLCMRVRGSSERMFRHKCFGASTLQQHLQILVLPLSINWVDSGFL